MLYDLGDIFFEFFFQVDYDISAVQTDSATLFTIYEEDQVIN